VHSFMRRLSVAPFLAARGAGVATLLTVHDFQLFCPRTWALRADGSPCPEAQLLRCAFGGCQGGLDGVSGRVVYALNTLRQRAVAAVVRRHATRIIAPSAALAGRLARSLRRDVGVVPCLPAPAPTAEFEPPRSRDLVFVGRLSREKGLRELLLAMDGAVRLTVAGDGPLRAELETLARERGLPVTFLGRVPRVQVAELHRAHGALVVPSICMENSPQTALEAFAAGRPVLAARRGGLPELVTDGETGLLFEPREPESIASALARFASMPAAEHEAMARRARARAEAASDRTAAFSRMEAEYLAAVASARAGAGRP
jgi:glycosyltransferase involved in cell wall biosynthesis